MASSKDDSDNTKKRKRCNNNAIRAVYIEIGVSSQTAAGSALVYMGKTRVLCQVYGPQSSNSDVALDEGRLVFNVKFAKASGNTSRVAELEIASKLNDALASTIPLLKYQKSVFELQLNIIENDGSVLAACINAASLALVDANFEMYHLVASASVAVHNKDELNVVVDPNLEETLESDGVVTLALAISPDWVTLWDQTCKLSNTSKAMDLAHAACYTMHKLMRTALVEHADAAQRSLNQQLLEFDYAARKDLIFATNNE